MRDLPYVASRVFGTPLMIARGKLEIILGVLAPRFGGIALPPSDPATAPVPLTSITADGVAVVSVAGTLVARSSYLDATSGQMPSIAGTRWSSYGEGDLRAAIRCSLIARPSHRPAGAEGVAYINVERTRHDAEWWSGLGRIA